MTQPVLFKQSFLIAVLAGLQGHIVRIPAAEVAAEVEQADRL